MSRAKMGERTRTDSCTWNLGQLGPFSGPSWTIKMDVVKLLELVEGFVRWVVVVAVGMRGERTYVNSPTREAALYVARGAARE